MKCIVQTLLVPAVMMAGFCIADSSDAKAIGSLMRPRMIQRSVIPVRSTRTVQTAGVRSRGVSPMLKMHQRHKQMMRMPMSGMLRRR